MLRCSELQQFKGHIYWEYLTSMQIKTQDSCSIYDNQTYTVYQFENPNASSKKIEPTQIPF
jgi:hypothetical protein